MSAFLNGETAMVDNWNISARFFIILYFIEQSFIWSFIERWVGGGGIGDGVTVCVGDVFCGGGGGIFK